jgi:hypothetical protein
LGIAKTAITDRICLNLLLIHWRENGDLNYQRATKVKEPRRWQVYYYIPEDVRQLLGNLSPTEAWDRLQEVIPEENEQDKAGSSSQPLPSEPTIIRERKKRERDKHILWQKMHDEDGLSYEQIRRKHERDTGETVSKSGVIMGIHRVRALFTLREQP